MAGSDPEKVAEILGAVSITNEGLLRVLGELRPASASPYTPVVNVPHYEPAGEQHAPADLMDRTRALELEAGIRAAEIDEETRAFLLAAAQRHVVFDYRRIAEFYAAASPAVQRLMEESVLVIVDVEDAIRLGYARYTAAIEALEEADS